LDYFSETRHAATWGAELERAMVQAESTVVEPTGAFMDDPNVTDKKYPGNPTNPIAPRAAAGRGEHLDWQGHSSEESRQ